MSIQITRVCFKDGAITALFSVWVLSVGKWGGGSERELF